MNPAGLLFLLLTVAGIAGITFVTAPGLDFMFGAATGEEDANIVSVIAWIVILWISTSAFVLLTVGGIVLTIVTVA